jgi:hypothetical protein
MASTQMMYVIQEARLKKRTGLVKCRHVDVKSFHESMVRNRQPEQFATPKSGPGPTCA